MGKDRFNEYFERSNLTRLDVRHLCKLGTYKLNGIIEGTNNRVTIENILLLARTLNVPEDEMFDVFCERARMEAALDARAK